MSIVELVGLGALTGLGAGLLAGLVGIGGGVVIVPAVYYGLTLTGASANEAAHVAVATSLASIVPASVVSFARHWKAGHADLSFVREWGPGIVLGVAVTQILAPHLDGKVLGTVFAALCLLFAYRFAFPDRFAPILEAPPGGVFRHVASIGIGACSGLAGVGGGILTNVVMTLSGLPMHKSVGRAAATGIVVSIPATIVAAMATHSSNPTQLGSIDLAIWACIAPAQAAAAWVGASIAARSSALLLSRIFSIVLMATGVAMLRSAIWS
ncbi:MAG: sulfite exporter TauE/SafE family protein [Reyranella sp.]|nr:sulfite exporter TauE/SafE family protein [Reyranella sp.]